jgi:hypothetical protein
VLDAVYSLDCDQMPAALETGHAWTTLRRRNEARLKNISPGMRCFVLASLSFAKRH